MNYIKVIHFGHVIEVYEMERIPVNPHELAKKDDYSVVNITFDETTTKENNQHYYEEQQDKIKHRENRKAERRFQTLVIGDVD